MTKIYMIAGEQSGDNLGAAFINGIRTQTQGDIHFRGIAGPMMQKQGMTSLFPMTDLSIIGVVEVLSKYSHLKGRIRQTVDDIINWNPDVVVTIDSPDFSLRVARQVKAQNPRIRTVHYVAPTVWAWRAGRAKKMVGVIDQVLALFPFEPPYFERLGIACDFTGHPVACAPDICQSDIHDFRQHHNINGPMVCVLPGSRVSEIARLLPRFLQAAQQCDFGAPAHIVLPTLPHLSQKIQAMIGDTIGGVPVVVVDGDGVSPSDGERRRRIAMAASDVAIAASGTVSLELASVKTPMVIAYDMNWLSWQIIQRRLYIDTFTLVNLVAQSRTVREFIGGACTPSNIANAVMEVIKDPAPQMQAMAQTMHRLGHGGEDPGVRAAKAVLARL